jgi:hypothetical protein
MSKLSRLSRGGWIVVGIVAALVLVPSAAVATTLTNTTNTKTAYVPICPNKCWMASGQFTNNSSSSPVSLDIPTPPAGDFSVIDRIQISTLLSPQDSWITVESASGVELAYLSPNGTYAAETPEASGSADNETFAVQPEPTGSALSVDLNLSLNGSPAGELTANVLASGYWEPCTDDAAAC